MIDNLQHLCERGQALLMGLRYLEAESALVQAEAMALRAGDWDTLARLYMPLQECRRQRRLRCGEGVVRLDLLARDASDRLDPQRIVNDHPHGQILVAGWGSFAAAVEVRALARQHGLYLECFLGAVYPLAGGTRCVAIVPTSDVALPPVEPDPPIDRLLARLPPFSLVLAPGDLPTGPQPGNAQTYARTMSLWEKLHLPFLAAADQTTDTRRRIDGYRRTIDVDYACELAHQRLADSARTLLRPTRH